MGIKRPLKNTAEAHIIYVGSMPLLGVQVRYKEPQPLLFPHPLTLGQPK